METTITEIGVPVVYYCRFAAVHRRLTQAYQRGIVQLVERFIMVLHI